MTEFKNIEKILIIKLRHIGDVLLTVPAIRAVRETFPRAYIAALVNKGTEEMLSGNPSLDEVIAFDRGMLKFPFYKRVKSEIQFANRIRRAGFDMAIDLTSGDRSAIYSYISGARYRIAFDPQKRGFLGKSLFYTHLGKKLEGRNHIVLQNLHLVRQFGMDTSDLSVDIHIPQNDEEFVHKILEKNGIWQKDRFIHIHPTARWLFKCWRDEYMAEIMDFCENEMGIKVVVTSGTDKKETDKINNILGMVKSSPVNLAALLTLKQLAAVSKRATVFFGVDTAPIHIAAATGTPVIALFGPTGSYDWGPWDNNYNAECGMRNAELEKTYSKQNGVRVLGKHIVIEEPIDCKPCKKGSCEGILLRECMDIIKPDRVKQAIETVILHRKNSMAVQ
ncbi:MAG: putative lipopolysaccharide heptosyltransferase III [Deltaproteobacteria bacterium]|nr:putative lipopolysaccharide heptosyltransferase III [Deltaproteobacteria bacterium]